MNHGLGKTGISLVMAAALTLPLILAGCDAAGSGTTADGHGVSLPNGVEAHLPLPEQASIRLVTSHEDMHIVMYQPGIGFPDAIEFFSAALRSNGWEVNREHIPERDQGERTAVWEATGHGVDLAIELTAFGGRQGFNMSGIIRVEP